MKITVIGHWGAYPKAGEATSGYLFEHNGFKLLVDCGSGVLSNIQHHTKLEEIDAVILSHYHYDHIADIGPLQYSRQIAANVIANSKPLSIYGHLEDEAQFQKLGKIPHSKAIAYSPSKTLTVGPFTITFLRTDHAAPCYAMKFQVENDVIVYSADSSYMDEFVSFSKDADVFLCECNFYAHQEARPFGHLNSNEAGAIAEKANAKHLILTHLPHVGEPTKLVSEASAIYKGKVTLAKKDLVINL